MDLDQILYHAEDVTIESKAQEFQHRNELIQWAEENNYLQHYSVTRKLKELESENESNEAEDEDTSDESDNDTQSDDTSNVSSNESDTEDTEEEDVIIMSTLQNPQNPVHLTREEKENICKTLNIPIYPDSDIHGIHRTKEDGNCLFRAVSYAISNTEDNHDNLRKKVVQYALQNKDQFKEILRSDFTTVNEYLQITEMEKIGTWTTEFEIFVLAHLLACDIYTHTYEDARPLKFSARVIEQNKNLLTGNILLEHRHKRHYNVFNKW